MTQKIRFKKAIGAVLTPQGFAAKGQSWYLSGEDSIVVLNIQKSDFDEKYFLNFGVWLKSVGSVDFPAANKCHIQARLTSLFQTDVELIERACRVDTDDTSLMQFRELLGESVVPFCKRCLSMGFLRSKLDSGDFRKALVLKEAKDALC